MNEQGFSIGSKGLHLFLDYKGKDCLTIDQFTGDQSIKALRTEIRKAIQ
jgi:hypothetical protein